MSDQLDDCVSVAVRPTPGELASARLSLLLGGRQGRVSVGLLCGVIGVGLAVGALQFLVFVVRYGVADAIRMTAPGILAIAGTLAAGVAVFFAYATGARDPISRAELCSGVLLHVTPHGLVATVRGATTYHDWEYVQVRELGSGIAFLLPRRAFHFLPYASMDLRQLSRVRRMLKVVAHLGAHYALCCWMTRMEDAKLDCTSHRCRDAAAAERAARTATASPPPHAEAASAHGDASSPARTHAPA